MKHYIILFFYSLCAVSAAAQNTNINWGEEYSDRGYYSIIGESQNAIFVERKYNTQINDRDADIEILRFDKNMELSHGVEVRNLEEGSYASIATVNSPEGLAHIYYQTTKKGEHFVSAQLFAHEDLRKTEIVDLARFKIHRGARQEVRQDNDFQLTFPLDILLSRDRSKLAIVFDQERAGKKKRYYHQYCVIDLEKGFSILQKGDFYSDEESNRYSISHRHLSDSGKLTYAIKRYVRNNSTEHINKKPAYDYEIHHMSGDSMEYIYDIPVRKAFMDRLILGTDQEDNLYISGYIRKQPFGDITRSFLMSLDAQGYERYTTKETFTRRDIKHIQGKEDNELDRNFITVDIYATEDIVYLVRQYRFRGSRNSTLNNGFYGGRYYNNGFNNNSLNNLTYHWDYDEVVVEGIGPHSGEVQWTTINPREHEDDDVYSRYFITGQMEIINGNLMLIYNEREENVLRNQRGEDIKRTDIPGDRTSITLARINPKGELRYEVLNEEDHFHLPERGAYIGKDKLYFFNQHKNYRKFNAGNINKSVLNF